MQLKNRSQNGAALMVALVLIFMISIMGISVMRNSSLEHRMASNSIQSSIVFQAAESVIEQTLNNPASLTAAYNAIGVDCQGQTIDWESELSGNDIHGLETNAQIRFTRTALAPGYSSDKFVALYFETLGASQIPSARAESAVIRGASRIVPVGPECEL